MQRAWFILSSHTSFSLKHTHTHSLAVEVNKLLLRAITSSWPCHALFAPSHWLTGKLAANSEPYSHFQEIDWRPSDCHSRLIFHVSLQPLILGRLWGIWGAGNSRHARAVDGLCLDGPIRVATGDLIIALSWDTDHKWMSGDFSEPTRKICFAWSRFFFNEWPVCCLSGCTDVSQSSVSADVVRFIRWYVAVALNLWTHPTERVVHLNYTWNFNTKRSFWKWWQWPKKKKTRMELTIDWSVPLQKILSEISFHLRHVNSHWEVFPEVFSSERILIDNIFQCTSSILTFLHCACMLQSGVKG